MVKFSPYWGSNVYGKAPKGWKDREFPQVLFIHANMLKRKTLGETTIFETLSHYDPVVALDGVGDIYDDTCLRLLPLDEFDVLHRPFESVVPGFEEIYGNIRNSL